MEIMKSCLCVRALIESEVTDKKTFTKQNKERERVKMRARGRRRCLGFTKQCHVIVDLLV